MMRTSPWGMASQTTVNVLRHAVCRRVALAAASRNDTVGYDTVGYDAVAYDTGTAPATLVELAAGGYGDE